jgi:hypothetical protein
MKHIRHGNMENMAWHGSMKHGNMKHDMEHEA